MELERLGISKREITAYNKKHIFTEEDLVRWFPRKYRDYTQFTDILDAKDGDFIAVFGIVGVKILIFVEEVSHLRYNKNKRK